MRVFVAGATGVIGRRAVAALVAAGHDVTGIARTPQKAAQLRRAGAEPVAVSLFDPDALRAAVAGHDAVVNLATKIPSLTQAAAEARVGGERRASASRARATSSMPRSRRRARAYRAGIDRVRVRRARRRLDRRGDHSARRFAVHRSGTRAAEASAARFTDGAAGRGRRAALRRVPGRRQPPRTRRSSAPRGAGVLLDVGRPDGYLPAIDADDAAAAVVRAVEDAPAGVYDVVDDEPITRRATARALARSVGRRRAAPAAGIRTRRGHGRSARRLAARLERPLPGRHRLAAAHARPGRRDRADGRRGRPRTGARARCSGIALAARGDGLGARDLRELPAPAVLRRLPVRPAVGVARRAVQRAPGARLRCDEPRARDRHARRAVLRVAGRGAAAAAGWLVFSVPHTIYHFRHLGHYETADQIGNVVSLSLGIALAVAALVLTGARRAPADRSYSGAGEPVPELPDAELRDDDLRRDVGARAGDGVDQPRTRVP